MSKNWYPIIDEENCVECGSCIAHCKNEVYDKENQTKPIVKNPDNCIENCHGCGNNCPVNAISYFGENK